MALEMCPYCESQGLLLTVKSIPGGLEVSGRCRVCGYTCDSDYARQDRPDDLLADFTNAQETSVSD